MLGNRKFIIDTMSEVYSIMKPYSDDEFWDLDLHETQQNSIYLLGRKQMVEHTERVRAMTQDPTITVIFGNSAEGAGRPWAPGEARVNRLVFIGRNLQREELNESFRKCLVS